MVVIPNGFRLGKTFHVTRRATERGADGSNGRPKVSKNAVISALVDPGIRNLLGVPHAPGTAREITMRQALRIVDTPRARDILQALERQPLQSQYFSSDLGFPGRIDAESSGIGKVVALCANATVMELLNGNEEREGLLSLLRVQGKRKFLVTDNPWHIPLLVDYLNKQTGLNLQMVAVDVAGVSVERMISDSLRLDSSRCAAKVVGSALRQERIERLWARQINNGIDGQLCFAQRRTFNPWDVFINLEEQGILTANGNFSAIVLGVPGS